MAAGVGRAWLLWDFSHCPVGLKVPSLEPPYQVLWVMELGYAIKCVFSRDVLLYI